MIRHGLLDWQWSDYSAKHQSRTNLLLHIVTVPLFQIASVILVGTAIARSGVGMGLGVLGMFAALIIQGRGHRGERETPEPFDGAAAQIATGLVLAAPLQHCGLVPKLSNDYLGAGLVWSQPSEVRQPAAHSNEYGFEVTYVLQLTPLASVQPDLQMIWNPANSFNADHNIFQLQLNLAW
jgi:hypothetical protein